MRTEMFDRYLESAERELGSYSEGPVGAAIGAATDAVARLAKRVATSVNSKLVDWALSNKKTGDENIKTVVDILDKEIEALDVSKLPLTQKGTVNKNAMREAKSAVRRRILKAIGDMGFGGISPENQKRIMREYNARHPEMAEAQE